MILWLSAVHGILLAHGVLLVFLDEFVWLWAEPLIPLLMAILFVFGLLYLASYLSIPLTIAALILRWRRGRIGCEPQQTEEGNQVAFTAKIYNLAFGGKGTVLLCLLHLLFAMGIWCTWHFMFVEIF